jgi:hypothetical protein
MSKEGVTRASRGTVRNKGLQMGRADEPNRDAEGSSLGLIFRTGMTGGKENGREGGVDDYTGAGWDRSTKNEFKSGWARASAFCVCARWRQRSGGIERRGECIESVA